MEPSNSRMYSLTAWGELRSINLSRTLCACAKKPIRTFSKRPAIILFSLTSWLLIHTYNRSLMFLSVRSHESSLLLSYFHTFRRIAPREHHLSADGGYVPVGNAAA